MKKIASIILITLIALFVAGCDKSMLTVEPDFEVTNYSVTDGLDSVGNVVKNVSFNLSGNADLISFYSGELFRDYAFKDGRVLTYNAFKLSFSTTVQFGTQRNQLSVIASTDFNGNYTPEGINAATWTDLTSRFALASTVGSTTPTVSGVVDITDIKVEGKPLYIAFKYVTLPQAANGTQNTWRVRDFNLLGDSNIGNVNVAQQTTAGWVLVNEGDVIDPNRAQIETGTIVNLRGNNVNTNIKTTTWAVTKAFSVSKDNLGPDRPINIKSYIDPHLDKYTYSYKQPGEYTVAFLAQNSTAQEQNKIVKTLKITIN